MKLNFNYFSIRLESVVEVVCSVTGAGDFFFSPSRSFTKISWFHGCNHPQSHGQFVPNLNVLKYPVCCGSLYPRLTFGGEKNEWIGGILNEIWPATLAASTTKVTTNAFSMNFMTPNTSVEDCIFTVRLKNLMLLQVNLLLKEYS